MFRRRLVADRRLRCTLRLNGIFWRPLFVFGGNFVYRVCHLQLLAVRRLRLQGCAKTNTEASGNFYRLKRRRTRLESTLYVVLRRNRDVALYACEVGRNRHRDDLELRNETKGD